jgi:tetratricopeptide (TPR) repeat protein/Na+-translocating ferredoxin:NAD+ oxidoreductase RnfE subunit
MPNQDSTRWWVVAEAALGVAVASLPLALGGAPAWTAWLLWGTSTVALGTWAVGAVKHHRRAAWHPGLWLPVVVAVLAVATLVPLPSALLEVVAPAKAELRAFALVPLGLDGPRAATLDPPSTLRALARTLSLGALGFVALQLGRREGVRVRLLATITATGALVALVGFGHLLAGAEALFGWWRFTANLHLLSFFGNSNHLAAYVAFSATVGLGLALTEPRKEAALGYGAASLVCAVAVFLTLSRGGIASFLLTWLGVGAFLVGRRQGGLRAVIPWVAIAATVVVAVGLASEPLLERLQSISSVDRLQRTKLELWPMFWAGARAYGPAGMGLGAFELGFTRFQTVQPEVTFTHPENLVLQWVAEAGLVVTLALVALGAFVAWRLVGGTRGALREQVVLFGVAGAFVHELFDFAFELNALPPSLAVALGLCAALEPEGRPEWKRWPVRPSALVLVLAVTLSGVAALAFGFPTHVEAERALAARLATERTVQGVDDAVANVVDRHPSDWVPYALAADRLSGKGSARESLAWVNRLLFLRPNDGRAHATAGRALLSLGDSSQALLEFTVAWRLGDDTSFDEGLRLAARTGAYDRLLVAEPGLLSRIWERYRVLGMLDAGAALLEAVAQLPPSPEVLAEARVLEVWQAQARQQPELAVRLLEQLPPELQSRAELVVLRATVLAQLGRPADAVAVLEPLSAKRPDDVSVATTLAGLLAQLKRTADARAALERVRPFVSSPAARCQLFEREADLWEADERWVRALEALQSASRIEPGRADLKYRLARVYERMGSLHSALDEVRKGRLLDSAEGAKAQDAWVARLESALSGRAD